jgi:broad specificity phosphatase PhoE
MTRVYLIRHGETLWNAEGRIQGHTDIGLTELGRSQARSAARRMADLPLRAVLSSDLCRASETADILARPLGLSVATTADLREAYLGQWQGMTTTEIAQSDADLLAQWRADNVGTRPPGAEGVAQVQERAVRALQHWMEEHAGESTALVSHGGPIKTLICWAIGAPLTCMRRFRMDNASISCIQVTPSRVELLFHNDTHHLEGVKPPVDVI